MRCPSMTHPKSQDKSSSEILEEINLGIYDINRIDRDLAFAFWAYEMGGTDLDAVLLLGLDAKLLVLKSMFRVSEWSRAYYLD